MPSQVGFVGFGEVASVLSAKLREGGTAVVAHDRNLARPGGLELLQKRARCEGLRFLPLVEAIRESEYVLSTVKPQTAIEVAGMCAAHLRAGQTYVDLNSVSPSVKAEIGAIIGRSGAEFVEGVILGAVGATGAAVPILTGGPSGGVAAERLRGMGLNVSHYSSEIGKASLFKMLRSIFSKGVEALLLEMLIAGKRAGMQEDLWKDVTRFMTDNPFDRVASNWIQTHAVAFSRRHHEIAEVAETMRQIGMDPLMTAATERFFARSCSLGLERAFPEKPATPGAVIEFMEGKA